MIITSKPPHIIDTLEFTLVSLGAEDQVITCALDKMNRHLSDSEILTHLEAVLNTIDIDIDLFWYAEYKIDDKSWVIYKKTLMEFIDGTAKVELEHTYNARRKTHEELVDIAVNEMSNSIYDLHGEDPRLMPKEFYIDAARWCLDEYYPEEYTDESLYEAAYAKFSRLYL